MLEAHSPVEGHAVCQPDFEENNQEPQMTQKDENHVEHLTKSVFVQTEYRRQDAETITDGETEKILKQLVSRREQLKDSYQEVLDRQTQAEKQLQVQIKQLKQKRDEEIHKHKENLKSIQDVTLKKEESRKKVEKEVREFAHKEQDLGAELVKLGSKNESLHQEHKELENKVLELLAEQTTEKAEWNAELTALKKKENVVTQDVLMQLEQAKNVEVLSLESRRELLLLSLEETEKEAEVTLSYLRVAPPHKEWMQLKQRWESRLAGIQQMKTNLREQFEMQIKQVKSGTKLSSLPSILAPNLPSPPSDPNVMLQRIALAPLQIPIQGTPLVALGPPKDHAIHQPLSPTSFPPQHPSPAALLPGNFPSPMQATARLPSASQTQGNSVVSGAPTTDKLSKILEKLQARFTQCSKGQLTDVLHQIKMKRGTLSGLTVDELCQLVAAQLQPTGHGRLKYHNTQASAYLPSANGAHVGRPQLCLICQQIVQPQDLQSMSCNHIMHQECIRFWALTNKNNSCPFCPTQR